MQFNWEDVKEDKQGQNYLGHSVKAAHGRSFAPLFVSLSGQLRIFLRLVPIPEDPVPCSCLSPVLAPVRLAAVVCIDCVPLRFLVCRWQKNKDLNWAWSRSKLDLQAANKSELQLAKERDADLMAQML